MRLLFNSLFIYSNFKDYTVAKLLYFPILTFVLLVFFRGTSCILTLRVAMPEKRMLLAMTTKAI